MPVPSNPQDLINLIREKLFNNTSGLIEEPDLREVLEYIVKVLDVNKLNKGTYTGTASDLFLNDQNLLQSLQNEQSARYSADQGLQNSKLDKGTYTGTAQTLKEEIDQKAFLKIFPSFADFPLPETLESTEENKLYLDRFTGEIYLVWYERADVDDPGMNLAYKKI